MLKQAITWKFIRDHLQRDQDVLLMYVLESEGSSPGRQGFFMAVAADGTMSGSLGGGIMEHKFVEMAKARLKSHISESSVHKQIHSKEASKNQSGMICSGEQTIFMYILRENDAKPVKLLVDTLEHLKAGVLEITPAGLAFQPGQSIEQTIYEPLPDDRFIYRQNVGYTNHIYIIGGGHCGLALSRLMASLDFYVHIIDDRPGLNTMLVNEFAHEKITVNNYSELDRIIPASPHTYLVIMTFGYRTDDIAVRALFYKQVKYFGLLGSMKKIEKMFTDYRTEGMDELLLRRILAPVGLFIKSETPEEIAVSIAAQIIRVKNLGSPYEKSPAPQGSRNSLS